MKNTCRYHYQNLDDMIYSSWDIEQNKLKLVILGHFLPFNPLKTQKIRILKNEKICWRHHFTNVHRKSQSYDVQFLRYGQNSFVTLGHFLPFYLPPDDPEYQNFEKKWKKWLEILSFYTYMCTINEDHIWFWKYKMQQTDIFNILGHFLPFQHLDNLENQKFNIGKNHLHHKWQSYDVWSLR